MRVFAAKSVIPRRRRGTPASALGAWAGLLVCAGYCSALAHDGRTEPPVEAASRVVHKFDFLEPGYFDPIPKGWYRFPDREYPDPAFPRYTEARLDHEVGHEAAPSFYLESKGRCVAYRYAGPLTRVRPGDYLVDGWIKPDRMRHSRAALSAYYLGWEGDYIAGTQRFSRLSGAPEEGKTWQQVRVHLPVAPPGAHFVGVTCWIVQQSVWRREVMPHRHISDRDVKGGAWFDDIVVLGLPRAILESAHPGNVVEHPSTPRLLATVADEDTTGLTARLVVHDQDGAAAYAADIEIRSYEEEKPTAIDLPALPAGLYVADLEVLSVGEPILWRTLTFAVLGRAHRPRGVVAPQMGVIFGEVAPEQTADVLALVKTLGVGAAKLPLWTGDPAYPGFGSPPHTLHDVLDEMIESRIAVVGTFSGPPAAMVRSVGVHARSLLDILSEDPRAWRSHLHAIVAPYASIFSSWQLGGDGDTDFIDDDRVAPALRAVRREMLDMIVSPSLTTVATAARWPSGTPHPAQNLSVELPPDIQPAFVGAHLQAYRNRGYSRLWVSIPLPEMEGFDRSSSLARWALRVIEARWAGVDTIFVPQLWRTRSTLYRRVTEPTQALVAYRTIVDTIADSQPTDRLNIGSTARALAFGDGKRAVLVMWDPAAPAQGASHTLQLGAATEAVDLWGRAVPLTRSADGRHKIKLSPVPVFVTGIEQWLVKFRAGLKLRPEHVDFAFETKRHMLAVTNPHNTAIAGEVVFHADKSWDVEPRRLRFALYPGETREFPLDVRHPNNETAGTKTIRARVRMISGRKYLLDVPLEFELGLSDVDVLGYAVMQGDRLLIHHGVTNRADQPMSFRTFAVYPGRSRQYRVINELLPGQTLTIEYRFANVAAASATKIRLGLREVNGPRIHNLQVVIP